MTSSPPPSPAPPSPAPPSPPLPSAPSSLPSLLLLLALLCGVLLALWTFLLPTPRDEAAPADVFSAHRARRHVDQLAKAPRPVGSPAHAEARAWLAAALIDLGAEVDTAPAQAVSTFYGLPFDTARVHNVIGRLRGSDATGTVLLVAHYDSVPGSPGASDNASGVAAILEVMRAARARGPLRNDVVVLFTDAEEGGMLGAHAFAEAHPWARKVRAFVNLDARGSGGVPVIVGLSTPGAWLTAQIAEASVTSAASSLYTDATRLIHPGTDFGVLSRGPLGMAGVNIAFADGVAAYHQGADTAAALDLGTLQAEGELALALLDQLGAADLAALRGGGDDTFFPVGRLVLVRYGGAFAVALGVLALALVAFAAVKVRRQVKAREVLRALLGQLWPAGLVIAGVSLAWTALSRLHPVYAGTGAGDPSEVGLLRAGVVGAGLAGAGLARSQKSAARAPFAWMLAGLLLWSVLTVGLLVKLPGTSHVATLPLLLAASWVLAASRGKPVTPSGLAGGATAGGASAVGALAVGALAAAAAGYFASQLVYLVMLAGQMPRAGVAAGLIVLFAMLVPPFTRRMAAPGERALDESALGEPALGAHARWLRRAAAGGALVALACFGAAALGARFDAAHPQPTCLTYTLDHAAGEARWISDERRPSGWSARFLPADAPRAPLPAFFADEGVTVRQAQASTPAPSLVKALEAPTLVAEKDERHGDRRTLRFRLRSPRGAPWAYVFVEGDTRVLAAYVEGHEVDPAVVTEPLWPGGRWGFRHVGLESDGLAFMLDVPASAAPLRLRVVDQSFALPPGVPARPAEMGACRSWLADSTLVSAAFTF
ncbi:M20/M25/M40 family metallo-hydrolase [Chondromyces apiculatus]|uniref:Peptidase M28 domain-containing protein n=1 Tax=Chondromyces apiculatus DSM 436 TaxID=1192034 RepID=A0A017T197_9BACT|nr:M20/M25/M40 family metallo-hydrolase [Chondromyces apiculatus]EYF02595.1 Hypothetical protein CAP_6706 [Chondromyces apiculatus DSM 436]